MDYLFNYHAKGHVTELIPSHIQSTRESRRERVRTAELVACYNYFKKKKNLFNYHSNKINWKKKITPNF